MKKIREENPINIYRVISKSYDWRPYRKIICDRSHYKKSWSAALCDYKRLHERLF